MGVCDFVMCVLIGPGDVVSENEIMQYTDPNYHDVNSISVSGYKFDADFLFYNESTSRDTTAKTFNPNQTVNKISRYESWF